MLVVSIAMHIGLFQTPCFLSLQRVSGPWVLYAPRDRLLHVIESVQILIYPLVLEHPPPPFARASEGLIVETGAHAACNCSVQMST